VSDRTSRSKNATNDDLGFAGLNELDRTPWPWALRERCATGDVRLLERVEQG
jgi:hypothetical protein